jgi:hypothetical protein
VQLADRRAPRKFTSARRTLFCKALQFQKVGRYLQQIPRPGKHKPITDLISGLWRVSLMLALNCSLLNTE